MVHAAQALANGAEQTQQCADPIHVHWSSWNSRANCEFPHQCPKRMPKPGEPSERKLTAVVVADVVGSSRLTAADEEGTIARLREL